MLEMQITEQKLGQLGWNFGELKSELAKELKKYDGLVITQDDIKAGKELRAKLNNVEKAINEKKKEVKKDFCAPYTIFEEQVKEVLGMVREVSGKIDVQVKEYEEKEKAEKRNKIEEFYNNLVYKPVPLEKIWQDKWLNKGCKDGDWQNDIDYSVMVIKKDLKIIDSFGEDDKEQIKAFYLETLDITAAKEKYEMLQRSKKQLEELQQSQKQVAEVIKEAPTEKLEEITEMQADEVLTKVMTIQGSKEQLRQLQSCMKQIGIKLLKVEK